MAIHRIATRIAGESRSKNEFMQPDLFKKTVKELLQLASTNFLKAIVEAGYVEDFYTKKQYEDLESSIERLS